MAGVRLSIGLLAGLMLSFGSLNTIVTKLQDTTVVGTDTHGKPIYFKHPAIQTLFMFMGESLCLVIYLLRRWLTRAANITTTEPHQAESDRDVKKASFFFIIPALCDTIATTLLNLGLYYTYASAFQMLRGTMVIFAGFFTVVILKRSLFSHQWTGILLITVGAALVGAASVLMDNNNNNNNKQGNIMMINNNNNNNNNTSSSPQLPSNPLLGNALVILAQVFQAIQFIVEEKFLVKYHTPVLLAIGSEGLWGLLIVSLSLLVVRIPGGADGGRIDDLYQALIEIRGNSTLQWSTAASILSIAVFNFFGVTVTKRLSGSARATIDACRTLTVWLVALQLGWEKFHFLSMVGFIVLLSGTSVYNEILKTRFTTSRSSHSGGHHHHRHHHRDQDDDNKDASQPLLLDDNDNPQYDIEHNRATASRVAFKDGHDIINPSSNRNNGGGGGAVEDSGGPSSSSRQQQKKKKKTVTIVQSINRRIDKRQQQDEYTMARSVTILPQALSPHSMASNPTPFPSSALLSGSSTESDSSGSSSSSSGSGSDRSSSGLSGEGGSDEKDDDGGDGDDDGGVGTPTVAN